MIRKISILFILFSFFSVSFASLQQEEGYLISPAKTPHGVIATNEFESSLYLINGSILEELISAPGCGRYFSVSADGRFIGFKYIEPGSYLQAPAIYDLEAKEYSLLEPLSKKAGQVTFALDGTIVYTMGSELVIRKGKKVNRIETGFNSNRSPVSPDGRFAVLSDENGSLWKFDVITGSKEILTDMEAGYSDAAWSPDGNKVAYMSVDARVFYKDLRTGKNVQIGPGETPVWNPEGTALYFFRQEIDFENVRLINSDIYEYNLATGKTTNVTNTEDVAEMHPRSVGKDEIIYDVHKNRAIKTLNLRNAESPAKVIYQSGKALDVKFFDGRGASIESTEDLSNYVHIHQVWDTRSNWDQGHVCCGATSAMQVLASYQILPKSPIITYNHVSDYGIYISDPYSFNGYTYTGYTGRWSSGIHGYMWNSSSPYGGSPQSNMTHFFNNHGVISSKTYSVSWNTVKGQIDEGYPYVLCSTGLTSGHIVVAIGLYGDGHTLYVNDPYGDKNVGNYGGIRNGKNAVYDWSDENTGHQKVTPIAWGVTARYNMFRLSESYPAEGMKNISRTVKVKLDFLLETNEATQEENIILLDAAGNPVAINFNNSENADGVVYFTPTEPLEEGAAYKVLVKNGLQDVEGKFLNSAGEINFTTGYDFNLDGRTLVDFETDGEWMQPGESSLSTGLNSFNTTFGFTGDIVFEGSRAGLLNYDFEEYNGVCALEYSSGLGVEVSSDTSAGLYVYGDLSGNELSLLFKDEQGNSEAKVIDTLNWSGWKFVYLPLDSLTLETDVKLKGLVLKRAERAQMEGALAFDNITLVPSPALVVSHSPAEGQVKVDPALPVIISFTRPMNAETVENAFSALPETEGSFVWSDNNSTLTFTPEGGFSPKTGYIITIGEEASDASGVTLPYPYSFSFATNRIELALVHNYPSSDQEDISRMPEIRLQFDGAPLVSTLGGKVYMEDSEGNKVSFAPDLSRLDEGFITMIPSNWLDKNAEYKIVLKQGIADSEEFVFQNDTEIRFHTESEELVSGEILDDLEVNSGWSDPEDNIGTTGTDDDNTGFSLRTSKRISGSSSGMLQYSFTGFEGGVCRLHHTPVYQIGDQANNSFGIWVYGDLSYNVLEYWFFDGSTTNHVVEADTINWTGWKFISVNTSEVIPSGNRSFHSLVIRQTPEGVREGQIYFDDIQKSVVTGLEEENPGIPEAYALSQNYPNPFNPSTVINFSLPEKANVKLAIYDVLGREVALLSNGELNAGNYRYSFNATGLASGVYIYMLRAEGSSGENFSQTKKMLLLK